MNTRAAVWAIAPPPEAAPPHHRPTYEAEQALALLVLALRHLQAKRTYWMEGEPTWVVALRQSYPAIVFVILAQHEEEAVLVGSRSAVH